MTPPKEGTASNQSEEATSFGFGNVTAYLKEYFIGVIDLRHGVDAEATIEDIKKKRSLAGANSWMLMCSIVIASIGLSTNSQALIIGAMLISPLMSPILGIGLSVGINDMETLRGSLAHFAIAIVIAVLTSYIYFEITPFNNITSEISARTEPTFLDIFVAIFGGFAGIISIARKDISTTIPGVAIATALMPPLCVTGYGLAAGSWKIASASFYLFFLNTFFVALSTFIIVRFLNFPYRHYLDEKIERKNIALIIGFSLALVVPSFFIFKNVINNLRLKNSLELFKTECLQSDGIYLDNHSLGAADSTGNRNLYLKVYGDAISSDNIPEYQKCLTEIGLDNLTIKIISTSDVRLDDVELIEQNLEFISEELEKSRKEKIDYSNLVSYYREAHIDSSLFDKIKDEIHSLYPDIEELGLANTHFTDFDSTKHDIPTVFIKWNNISTSLRDTNDERISQFLKARLSQNTLKVISY